MKRLFKALACSGALVLSPAMAQEEGVLIKKSNLYIGGGVGFNSLTGFGNGTGIQALAGYRFDLAMNNNISGALELGYMDSGNFKTPSYPSGAVVNSTKAAKGVWINLVGSMPVGTNVSGLVRIGFDIGDDDGLMAGTGLDYAFSPQLSLRTEYVVRDDVNSLQFNVLFRL